MFPSAKLPRHREKHTQMEHCLTFCFFRGSKGCSSLTRPYIDPVLNQDATQTPSQACVCLLVIVCVCSVYVEQICFALLVRHCCKHPVTKQFLWLLADYRGDSVVRGEWNVWQTSSCACVCACVHLLAACLPACLCSFDHVLLSDIGQTLL